MIPKEVMLQAQQEFLNFNETGISVMEMSHRSKEYLPIVEKAEKSLRTLLKIPNNYKVLFLQGVGSAGSSTDRRNDRCDA